MLSDNLNKMRHSNETNINIKKKKENNQIKRKKERRGQNRRVLN